MEIDYTLEVKTGIYIVISVTKKYFASGVVRLKGSDDYVFKCKQVAEKRNISDRRVKISSLSFELERTTRAANILVSAFILFISMFILFLPIVLISCITSILGYIQIYTIQVLVVLMSLIMIFMVISSILMLKIIPSLMSAYRIEEDAIVCGVLRKVPRYAEKNNHKVNLVTNAALMVALKDSDSYIESRRAYTAIKGSSNIFKLIKQNTDPYFVKEFFDTECFNKKIYYNPVLVKTTKYAYIYKCDNKKRLVIRKLYSNMGSIGAYKPRSLKQRMILPVLLVVLLTSILTGGTIYAHMVGTNAYNDVTMLDIESKIETYVSQFENIGYELDSFEKNSNTGFYQIKFRYHCNEDTDDSVVSYRFGYDGKIKLNNIYLYIHGDERDGNRDLNNELNILLNFPSEQFSENNIDELILGIQDAIDDKIKIKQVNSDDGDFGIIIKRFDSCVCVYKHN